MWDLIVSVPDHCLSFYFTNPSVFHYLRYNVASLKVYFLVYIP